MLFFLKKRILVVIENVLSLTWSPEAGPKAELYSELVQREHFILNQNTLKLLCGNAYPPTFVCMKKFRSVPIGRRLSGISMLWEFTTACSRPLYFNEKNALALGEGGSLHSWPPVLSFWLQSQSPLVLNVQLHSSRCKYSHWDQ